MLLLVCVCILAIFAYDNKDEIYYEKVNFDKLKGWKEQDFIQLKYTFINNCIQLQKYYKKGGFNEKFGSLEQWAKFCSKIEELPNEEKSIRKYFETLDLLQIHQPFEKMSLFTGYYSPLLNGSFTKTPKYHYPLYKRPPDLIEANLKNFIADPDFKYKKLFARLDGNQIIPYYTRKQIDDDLKISKDNVLIWVEDKIQAFFLHIQGSGQVMLDDRTIINVGYAAQNGHSYYAIGRYMVKHGMLKKEEVSLQSIRKYLEENPKDVDKILNENPSYIFFAEKSDGPYGAFGNVLTPEHSVAIDRNFIPLGLPLFIDTKVTATNEDFRSMVFAQDIGGAIKGAVRADIFFGSDDNAEEYSGKQNSKGVMYVFSAKNI